MSNLLISRAPGERFLIQVGDTHIWICVLEVRRRHQTEVRISIEAPLSVRIARNEILPPEEQYQRERETREEQQRPENDR